VATLTHQLQRRGIPSTFLTGLLPLDPTRRLIGTAHTLRYLPVREDLLGEWMARGNAQREAVEELEPDEVLVIDARSESGAGTIGDLYALRASRRGAAGIVTDGALRDTAAIAAVGIPVYYRGSHGATLARAHLPADHQVPIACAGVTSCPATFWWATATGWW
jgi:regulator of RNase E activity RraA